MRTCTSEAGLGQLQQQLCWPCQQFHTYALTQRPCAWVLLGLRSQDIAGGRRPLWGSVGACFDQAPLNSQASCALDTPSCSPAGAGVPSGDIPGDVEAGDGGEVAPIATLSEPSSTATLATEAMRPAGTAL